VAYYQQLSRRYRNRRRLALILTVTSLTAAGGCGVTAGWYLGLFTSSGRFAGLDALHAPAAPGFARAAGVTWCQGAGELTAENVVGMGR
jgi:hypothetical protein